MKTQVVDLTEVVARMKPGQLFINNEWVEASTGRRFDVINPATEEKITDVAEAGVNDVDLAVVAARRAFESGEWKNMTARDRGRLLHKIADLLRENKEGFAELESLNNGKPISETLNVDLPLTIDCFEYYAGLADKIHGETIPVSGEFFNYTLRSKPVHTPSCARCKSLVVRNHHNLPIVLKKISQEDSPRPRVDGRSGMSIYCL